MTDFNEFVKIRRMYAALLPEWMENYAASGNMCHDPYFMDWQLTPIESDVWRDIRGSGLPFYPQVPVMNYFLDFACPMLKIGIECDGKEWHSYEKDKARDARLANAGWMIFRIEGHECRRVVEPFEDCEDSDPYETMRLMEQYFMTTSEGVVRAINHTYFGTGQTGKYSRLMESTLHRHRSTPETYPRPNPIVYREDKGPQRMSDTLDDYFSLLMRRMERTA